MRFALVSREVYPFVGGGLSRYVTATAEALSSVGEVVLFTTSLHARQYRKLKDLGSPDIPAGVRFVFVDEPTETEVPPHYLHLHAWSSRVYDALKSEYGAAGPDLLEFPDYLGEGCVSVQARQAQEAALRETAVCIRLYTTSEMTSVLNGSLPTNFDSRLLFDLERIALRYADWIIEPGGDVYDTFTRFYAPDPIAPRWEIPHVVSPTLTTSSEARPSNGGLRLLYLGRMERRKGVQSLVHAVMSLVRDDWTLTLAGGDTDTAPLGTSMRTQLELTAAGHPKITFLGAVSAEDVPGLIRDHDLCVLPSLWECWPNVALEALSQNRPLLASPVGGLTGIVEPQQSGWLCADVGEPALVDALNHLLDAPEGVVEVISSGAPRARFDHLTDPDVVRTRYSELVEAHRSRTGRRRRADKRPLVTVVVTYFELEEFLEETLESIFAQTYGPLEVIVVNDGSFREPDGILWSLASSYPFRVVTQPNSGLGAARNFGIGQARGRYVLPFDADDLLAPTFVERCLEVLLEQPGLAYVTSWSDFIDEGGLPVSGGGYRPLGNSAKALDQLNVAGSAEAVFDRRIFDLGHTYSRDLTSYEDWLHYRELQAAGFEGHVIPEVLLWYRIRSDSMVRTTASRQHDRLVDEMKSRLRAREVEWTPKSG